MTGQFITVEGGEGAGKTTALDTLQAAIEAAGHTVVRTREPGGTPLAEQIREMLLQPREESVDPTCELLLFFAARAQHVESLIRPQLEQGVWVLCDRFTDSTVAYQGYGRELGVERIEALEQYTLGGFHPDQTIVLDIDPLVGRERALSRGAGQDRMEAEALAFHQRVREGFLERAQAHPERYRTIDASQSLESVTEALRGLVGQLVVNQP